MIEGVALTGAFLTPPPTFRRRDSQRAPLRVVRSQGMFVRPDAPFFLPSVAGGRLGSRCMYAMGYVCVISHR